MSHTSSHSIPKTQRAAVVSKAGPDANIEIKTDYPVRPPSELLPGECLVKILATGVCHSDLHVALGDWPTPFPPKEPLVGGHEGVGEIVAIGDNTTHSPVKIGDRVGIKWLADSCLDCEQCRKGREQNCNEAQLSGFTVDGTFQEYVVSYVHHVTPIPDGYDSAEAASVMCAGVTVYRALKYSQTNPGDYVVVPGSGGGLGHIAIQYAKAMGLKPIAIDTGAEKKELSMSLGAAEWIDFKQSKDIVKSVLDVTEGLGAHSTIVTTSSPSGYEQAVEYLRPGGTLMAVGLPTGDAKLQAPIFNTVFKSISIIGSYVGNRQDSLEAVQIAASGAVKVHYAVNDLSHLQSIYDGLASGSVAGRIVVDMTKK